METLRRAAAAAFLFVSVAAGQVLYNASDYAYGTSPSVPSLNINSVVNATTVTLTSGVISLSNGGFMVAPLNTNASIIVGSGSNTETVTPSQIICNTPAQYGTCTLVATFTKQHYTGEPIRSATFGLQEAINAAHTAGGGIVSVNASWFAYGGTTGMISAATLPSGVSVWNLLNGISGGGASNLTQIQDFTTTATATTLTNTTCATTTPCNASVNGSPVSPFTGQPYGANLVNSSCTSSSCSGNIFEYIDVNGAWTFLYGNNNFLSGGLVCNSGWTCTFSASVSAFPIGVCPLYEWTVAGGAINATPLVDQHGLACRSSNYTGGTNVTVSPTGVISATGGSSSAGSNGVLQESNGSGGFTASTCTDAFGVINCSTRSISVAGGFAAPIGQGFGLTTCSTTGTIQTGGLNVFNVTGNCTLSISGGGSTDGILLELLACEDATGGHTITLPAALVGAGTPVTTANKCNAQWFVGSTGGGTLGGHTLNATWYALGPMVSY